MSTHYSDPRKPGYSLCKAEDKRENVAALVCYKDILDVTCKRCLKMLRVEANANEKLVYMAELAEAPCCPKCKSTGSYSYDMTETHKMGGMWGGDSEAGDSGYYVTQSLISCDDCGAKFQWNALVRKGLVHGMVGRR